jgi:hypothetical protein
MSSRREKIRKIVEAAISDYGGDTMVRVVSWHMERTYSLDPGDVLIKPETAVKALRAIYGDFEGIIEGNICERIAKEYGIDYRGEGLVELSKELNDKQ